MVSRCGDDSIFKKEPRRKHIFMVISPAEGYMEARRYGPSAAQDVACERGHAVFEGGRGRAVESAKKRASSGLPGSLSQGNTDFSALLTKLKSVNPTSRCRHLLRRRGASPGR